MNEQELTSSSLDVSEVGLDTEGSVELISLCATSNVSDGVDSSSASSNSLVWCSASVIEDVADGEGDDVAVQSRSLAEFILVFGLEAELSQLAAFKSGTLSMTNV